MVCPSPIHGFGVFARAALPKGTRVGPALEKRLGEEDPVAFDRTFLARYVNEDQDDPNLRMERNDQGFDWVTVRPVESGDELTADYSQYEELMREIAPVIVH